jgi:hypothetical protein
MRRLTTLLCLLTTWACTPAAVAPSLDGGTLVDTGLLVGTDAGPVADAGSNPSSDAGSNTPGSIDAGFVIEPGPPGSVLAECENICGREAEMRSCGVEFVEQIDRDRCALFCSSLVASMEPANAQAFLDCTVNVCRPDHAVDCAETLFLGPTPSQTCIEAGHQIASCPDSDTHFFEDAWRCESYRSPSEQSGLGGTGFVECLASSTACGDMASVVCLTEAMERSGRSAAIQELCRPVANCDQEQGFGCRAMASGITPVLGGRHVEMLGECIAAAQGDCDALAGCADWDLEEAAISTACREGCSACGEDDWTETCQNLCNWTERSLSGTDARSYTACVTENSCNLPHQLAACSRRVLPELGATCERFWQRATSRCNEWREVPAAFVEISCSLSGVRTGTIDEAALLRCADRMDCTLEPLDICLKGRLGD